MPSRADAPIVGTRNASPECLAVLDEVVAREIGDAARLGNWHQMTVDAYHAQHVAATSPPIAPAFALIGLYLALERGLDGLRVRDAHGFLARTRRDWPRFEPPMHDWPVTVRDVATADGPVAHLEQVRRWGASAWEGWLADQQRVRDLADGLLRGWRPR